MTADIKAPDSKIARDAEELARTVSNDMLFNHVMRCYWFGEFFARKQGVKVDSELMFLSSVLHDLGLTPQVPGPHRFEIEGASAARKIPRGQRRFSRPSPEGLGQHRPAHLGHQLVPGRDEPDDGTRGAVRCPGRSRR